jgi:hypothetical protein
MFMHTNVCIVQELNPRSLFKRQVFGPLRRQISREIISSSSSLAHYSPLLDIGLCNVSPSRSIFGYSHPAPTNRPAQILTPPGLNPKLRLQDSFTPAVVGSTADMVNLLPLQRANTVCFVGDLVSNSIPQRNPELSSFHSSLKSFTLLY